MHGSSYLQMFRSLGAASRDDVVPRPDDDFRAVLDS